jgi:hypothetical protein
MLRLVLLLLCSETFLNASSSGKVHLKKTIAAKKFDKIDEKYTPPGVAELNLSGTKTSEIELLSPLFQKRKQANFSPKLGSSGRSEKFSFARGCGTPLNDLFEKFPSDDDQFYPLAGKEDVSAPIAILRSSSEIDEEEEVVEESESSGSESEYNYESEDVNSGAILLEVEARRNDELNSAFEMEERAAAAATAAAAEDITEGLGTTRSLNNAPSPASIDASLTDEAESVEATTTERVTIRNRWNDLNVEEVTSDSDNEYFGWRRDSVDSDAEELNLGNAPRQPSAKLVKSDSDVTTAAAAPSATSAPVIKPAAFVYDVMKFRSIDSVIDLEAGERMLLTAALHNQISKSENFHSPVKFADMPQGIFMHKISLVVRRIRKTLLTRNEMESSDLLVRTIRACNMNLKDLYEVIELLKRAGRDYASEKLVSKVLIPYLIKAHDGGEEARKEEIEKSVLTRLSIYGHVLLLNDLLKHSVFGKSLRSHLTLHDIQMLLTSLITNGTISDEEIVESMNLLLKGYDFEEFKASSYGKELIELCETNRKGLIQ